MPDFSALIKPASSLCNMNCSYCFYADESAMREVPSYGLMSSDTAHKIIERAYEYTDNGNVSFAFQGGEPTLAGLSFFEDFISFAKERRPEKVRLNFSIQTNGLLIDEKWCELFKENDFLVGISIDGPQSINDRFRLDRSGQGCFKRAMNCVRLLRRYEIEFNILSVITKQAALHPTQLWNFYKNNDIDYVQLIPCLAPLENRDIAFAGALTPQDYSSFLISFFRLWSEELAKGYYISVRLFDNLVRMAMGQMPEMCGMSGACSAQCVIEADGGVYPCDFYVLDSYLIGNIRESTMSELFSSEVTKSFLIDSLNKPSVCGKCKFFGICRGGCKRCRAFYMSGKSCPYADFLEASHVRIAQIAKIIKTTGNPG